MASNQNTSVMRSQVWNSAIPVAEAGIEDGLQLINKYAGDFEKLTNWSSTAGSDNWSVIGANTFYVRRYYSDCYYDVYVTNTPLMPSIRSVGYTLWRNPYGVTTAPVLPRLARPSTMARADTYLARRVDIKTLIDSLFAVAMAAKQTIDFNGRNVATDSFDSSDPNFSILSPNGFGLYPMGQLGKTKANGDVVTDFYHRQLTERGQRENQGPGQDGTQWHHGYRTRAVR